MSATSSGKSLFSPVQIGSIRSKNRIAVAPMSRVSASDDGQATDVMTRYYERYARGGFGIVITEGIYTDQAFSQAYHHQPGITDEAQAEAWKPIVEAIKRHGSVAIAQMMHAGATSQGNRFVTHTAGPSSVLPKGKPMPFYYGKDTFPEPVAMTEEHLADAIDGFSASSARAVEIAGFEAIEIHGANGYLLDQFLTEYTNKRTDGWGGSTEARLRLTVAVLKAVKDRLGPEVPIGVRISQGKVNDNHHKWSNGEHDAETIFGHLADAGVGYIHLTESDARSPAFPDKAESLVRFARKYAPNTTLIANGNLHGDGHALEALEDGADIVSFGKAALANPDLPNGLASGAPLKAFDIAMLLPVASIKEHELLT